MSDAIIFGPTYSTYVRTVRLALEEKPAAYTVHGVAMLQGKHHEPTFLERNPFGKVPAFEHEGMTIYETNVITRYIDRVMAGVRLQPDSARDLARMDQVISIADSFAYGCVIGKLVWQRIVTPMVGGAPDEAAVIAAMPSIKLNLREFDRLLGDGPWFAGAAISLVDLHLAPIFAYLTMTPESAELLAPHPALASWWARMSARESMAKTQPQLG